MMGGQVGSTACMEPCCLNAVAGKERQMRHAWHLITRGKDPRRAMEARLLVALWLPPHLAPEGQQPLPVHPNPQLICDHLRNAALFAVAVHLLHRHML